MTAGRDLTAADVEYALSQTRLSGYIAARLNRIARAGDDEPRPGDRCPATGVVWDDERARAAILRALHAIDADFSEIDAVNDILDRLRGDEHLVGDRSLRIAREQRARSGGGVTAGQDEPQLPDADGWTHHGDLSVHLAPAAPAVDTAAPTVPWPGVASAEGTYDRIVAKVQEAWPEHRERTFPGGTFDDEQALIEFAVHITISMLQQQDPAIAPSDTAAPDLGPVTTADRAVAACAKLAEAWAHLRMDTAEDQTYHDRLVEASRAVAAAYMRGRAAAPDPLRAPVEALRATLDRWVSRGQHLIPVAEVRRHLDEAGLLARPASPTQPPTDAPTRTETTVEYRVADGPQPGGAHPDERPVTAITRERDQVEAWLAHWRSRWDDARIESRTRTETAWTEMQP